MATVAFSQFGRGGDEQGLDLIGRRGAGLHRAPTGDQQGAQRVGVFVFRHGQTVAGQCRPRRGVGIQRIGLALTASRRTVGTDHFGDLDAGALEGTGQAGAVGAGALNSGDVHVPKTLRPLDRHVVAGRTGRKLGVSQWFPRPVEDGEVNGVQMSVGADDDDAKSCHDGGVSLCWPALAER